VRRSVSGAFAAGLAVLVANGAVLAEEGSSGMPQLNYHDFAPQLVWLSIAFVALYFVMSRFAVPRIEETLAKRQAKIQGDLDAAEKANEETRALVADYEKRLADAREDARRLTRERGEADSAGAAALFKDLHDRLARQIDEAEKRIAAQRDDVMAGLEHMARDIGQEVYAKIAGQPADQGALAGKVTAAIKGGSR
jgi:F-type H+-transporting ATPase subunit b